MREGVTASPTIGLFRVIGGDKAGIFFPSTAKAYWKGFPRGRVERAGPGESVVFHADDLAETGINQERIERAFELGKSKVTWSIDPHEKQHPKHRAALDGLLAIRS